MRLGEVISSPLGPGNQSSRVLTCSEQAIHSPGKQLSNCPEMTPGRFLAILPRDSLPSTALPASSVRGAFSGWGHGPPWKTQSDGTARRVAASLQECPKTCPPPSEDNGGAHASPIRAHCALTCPGCGLAPGDSDERSLPAWSGRAGKVGRWTRDAAGVCSPHRHGRADSKGD